MEFFSLMVAISFQGADIIGVNCKFDPTTSLRTLVMMREALDREGLNCHLMIQPVGYHTPDAARTGFSSLPELPFGKKGKKKIVCFSSYPDSWPALLHWAILSGTFLGNSDAKSVK